MKGQAWAAFWFGVLFVTALLVPSFVFPGPSPFTYSLVPSFLGLTATGVLAGIPGFSRATVGTSIKAGAAMAIFVIVFFFSPAALVVARVAIDLHDAKLSSDPSS